MKRLDINLTDSTSEVLEDLKRRTERSKTELVHDAIGLLWLSEKAYAQGHAIAEVDAQTGEVVSRLFMPMFERPQATPEFDTEWEKATEILETKLSMIENNPSLPLEEIKEEEQALTRLLERLKTVEKRAALSNGTG